MSKVNNKDIKRLNCRHSDVFIGKFQHIQYNIQPINLMFLLLTKNFLNLEFRSCYPQELCTCSKKQYLWKMSWL